MTNGNFGGMLGPSTISIDKLELFALPGTNIPLVHRDLSLSVTNNTLNQLGELLLNANAHTITQSQLATYAPGISTYAANDHTVDIVNGWGQQRLTFILSARSVDNAGNISRYYIQGYSEYYEKPFFGSSGRIDPDMRFYINSVTELSETPASGYLHRPVLRLRDSFRIINEVTGKNNDIFNIGDNNNDIRLIRPFDINMNMHATSNNRHNNGIITTNDSDRLVKATTSKRNHDIPLAHTTAVINSLSTAHATQESFDDPIYRNAAIATDTSNPFSNPLLFAISQANGINYGSMSPGWFTENTLKNIDPDLEHKVAPVLDSSRIISPIAAEVNTYNTGYDPRTLIANKVMAYLSSKAIESLWFNITGGFIAGMPSDNNFDTPVVAVCKNYIPEINGDLTAIADFSKSLSAYVYHVVAKDISDNGKFLVNINFYIDVFNKSYIQVGVEGWDNNSICTYEFSSFADSLQTMVMTDNATKVDITNTYEAIIDTTMGALSDMRSRNIVRY